MGFAKVIELFVSFFKIGLTAFGGPAMVAYIKELAVDKKRWLDEKSFQQGIALAQAIPGATAMQVAAFVGFKTRGILLLFDKTLFSLALVMMKIDIFAFGGGYASLPLMLHEFVDRLRWLDGKTFMDGIALGQVTPGPIVITATFVGYLLKGFIGAIVATVAVFSPSFLIMALASEIGNKIKNSKTFIRAKKGILSSFSGLLLFAMIKFIGEVDWNVVKILLALISFIALLRKVSIFYVVVAGAVFSILFFY